MANFSISESPILPRVHSTNSSPRCASTRDWEEFSSALLEDGFVLTALELHTELLECGKEVPSLRDYFSNPGNFEHAIPQPPSGILHSSMVRTSSLSTFDSIELGRYSDDLDKENDDRVAVLEFELRKAYETIKSLRGSLTEAATEVGTKKDGEAAKIGIKSDDPIKLHEKRALNFLAHEYLMQQDNKLTAITFTEENGDQDFDDWDDVGLNIPKPPDLLYLFRNYSMCMLSDKDKVDRIKNLEDQLSTVMSENLALKRENETLHQHSRKKRSSVASLKKDNTQSTANRKLRRRSSSLTDMTETDKTAGAPPSVAMELIKKREEGRTSSSPDLNVVDLPSSQGERESSALGEDLTKDDAREREVDRDLTGTGEETGRKGVSENVSDRMSVSTTGSVSAISGDDVETVVDENEEVSPQVTRRGATSGGPLLSSDLEGEQEQQEGAVNKVEGALEREQLSASCSTLENEKQEGEREESVESQRRMVMSVSFRQELLNVCQLKTDPKLDGEVAKLASPSLDVIQMLGRSLPHIMPHMMHNKREDLIPIMLCVISRHPESKVREQLLQIMYNLTKKPDRNQRLAILSGCVGFVKLAGQSSLESELLPQLWEQITHKHYERRLLVAESCGVLAPYIPAELRGSLVLSMLKQMLSEDKAESVRQAVVRSLAIIVAFTDDEDKFKQCWELLLKTLTDSSQLVVSTAYTVLLPALAAWAFELDTLEVELLSYFLHQLLTCIKQVSRSEGESGSVEQSQHHLLTLTHLVPWHYATVLLSGPYVDGALPDASEVKEVSFPKPSSPLLDIQTIIGDAAKLNALVAAFEHEVTTKGFSPWKSLEWFQTEYLGKFMRISVTLGFSQSELVHSLAVLLSNYCRYFGHTFTHTVLKPYFERSLKLPKQNPGAALAEGKTNLTTSVLPIYVSGILSCFKEDEKLLVGFLRSTLVDIALYFGPLDSLKATFSELKRERRLHGLLLNILHDLITHTSFQVRRYVGILLGLMVRGVEEKLILKGVLPQLTKLARDSEISVRVDTIASFGTIMETVTSKDILVRVHQQFEHFLSKEQSVDHQVLMAVLRTLAKIGPNADPVFRDEFIIPRLAEVAEGNNSCRNLTKKQDIALSLVDAYRNISECFVSVDLLTDFILPGLESVKQDIEQVAQDKLSTVEQLIKNCSSKVSEYQKNESSEGGGEGKAGTFFSKLKKPHFDRPDISISPSKFFKKKT